MEVAAQIVESEKTMPEVVDPDHSAVVAVVSEKFSTEFRKLKDLQDAIEIRRAEQELHKKKTREQAANEQADLLKQLLTAQVSEQQERAKKQATLNKILAALLTVATSGGGAGIYLATRRPSDEEQKRRSAPVVEAVAKENAATEQRVEKAEKKIERLGEIAVELQVQQSDGIDYIGSKIDAAHPRQAGDVEPPPSVQAAKRKADKIKTSKRAKELFSDEEDPFGGL